MDIDDAWGLGADAALAGALEDANPFDPETQVEQFNAWNDGWADILASSDP